MPYLHPFRFRSHSDPTPLKNPSFTVDRTTTIHTVFTMVQLDGSSESKPSPSSPPLKTPARTNTIRKRFANLFGTNKRTETGLNDFIQADEPVDDNSPMRVLSPRATEYNPSTSTSTATPRAPRARQRTFSFKHRQSNRISKVPSLTASTAPQPDANEVLSSGGDVPVTDAAYQSPLCQPRKDSMGMGGVGMPTSPTREAALTSHPVVRVQEVERGK